MKTQIITLAAHDDSISVRDKLSWAKSPRVLLVWPKYEKISLRLLDLKVLQRHADSLGAQLGLVTRRLKVRRDAESLGIPVFASASAAQKKAWPQPAPRTRRIPAPPRKDLRRLRESATIKEAAWRHSLPGRVIVFAVGVLSVLILSAVFFPRAELVLYPQMQQESVTVPLTARTSFETVSVTGEIPSRVIKVVVSADRSMQITGNISLPKNRSTGVVRFTNLSLSDVDIPAGTVVSTFSGERFSTEEQVFLSAGLKEFVDVSVSAMLPGAQGNVQPDKVTLVEGPLALSVTVTNPEAMTGGTNVRQPGATEANRESLRAELITALQNQAETKIRSQIRDGDVILIETLDVGNTMSETFDPLPGQPGESLSLSMQVEFKAEYIALEDMQTLARMMLAPALPDGYSAASQPSFEVTRTDAQGQADSQVEIKITRNLIEKIDPLVVFASIRGSRVDSLPEQLSRGHVMRMDPLVKISPDWWPWMPLLPLNISLEVR